jgi:hypothetical protein
MAADRSRHYVLAEREPLLGNEVVERLAEPELAGTMAQVAAHAYPVR